MTDRHWVERIETVEGTEIRIVPPTAYPPLASLVVSVDNAVRLALGTPQIGAAVDPSERRDLYARLIAEAELLALAAGCAYMEARPPSATPDHAEWEQALKAHGFTLTSEKTALQRSLDGSDMSAALAVASADKYARTELARLYASCLLGTLDRSDAGDVVDAALSFAALVPEEKSGSWVALVEQVPAGIVVVELTEASAWIAFVGVAEQFRRQNIGYGLLRFALKEAALSGRTAVRALIDIGNEPSLRLHRKAGFEQSLGTFRIYQRRLGASG